jgi:hypothetical protein
MTAIAVLVGLAAMHGITASSASAAAPCGLVVAHDHGGAPVDTAALVPTLSATTLSAPVPIDADHAGMACLVILLAGFVVALTVLRRRDLGEATTPVRWAPAPTRTGRGPPPLLLTCVSRT